MRRPRHGVSDAEIGQRMPIWLAMSEIFLDTELDAADYARIRAALAQSGRDSLSLRAIFDREVAPVLGHNLMAVAGEWAFWSEDDLRRLLVPRLRRGVRPSSGWIVRLILGRHLDGEWAKIDPGAARMT